MQFGYFLSRYEFVEDYEFFLREYDGYFRFGYGSVDYPNTMGSGGTPGFYESAPAGSGGGAVVINVTAVSTQNIYDYTLFYEL